MHMDCEGCRDGTRHPVPFNAINTAAGHAVGQLRPGSRWHVEMIGVAISLVRNLVWSASEHVAATNRLTMIVIVLPLYVTWMHPPQ